MAIMERGPPSVQAVDPRWRRRPRLYRNLHPLLWRVHWVWQALHLGLERMRVPRKEEQLGSPRGRHRLAIGLHAVMLAIHLHNWQHPWRACRQH